MDIKKDLPGFIVVFVIAAISYYVSTLHPSFDSLVISIIIGMFLGNIIIAKDYFKSGIESSIKIFLPVGIAFYGSQLGFKGLSFGMIANIFLIFLSLFVLTLLIARIFSINNRISILLASGLAVCGASAIAIISPLIGAKREDTSVSIISVMMLGLIGMIFYPILFDIFSLTKNEFNFITGTTLPMLGQVKVAASSVCPECLSEALKIKLIRVSFLVFLITTAIFLSGMEKKRVRVPWFVIVFIVLAVIFNSTEKVAYLSDSFKIASSFSLTAGLAAIGLLVDFDSVIEEGLLPFGAIFLSWSVVILIIYLIRNLF